jgi:hypothetical protein
MERFGDRFALAALGHGGLVLDRRTGAFWQLDGAAWAVAESLAAGATDEEAARAARAPAALVRDVRALADAPDAPPGDNPVSFRHDSEGHVLCWDAEPVVRVGPGGAWLAAEARVGDPVAQARLALPDALVLRGVSVLHAASVRLPSGVEAFLGSSGAGKTTLAHALVDAGCPLVSEDLLLVRELACPTRGEYRLRAWCERAGPRLASGERAVLSEADVAELFAGPSAPLAALHVLAPRHLGPDLVRERLPAPEAVAALLGNALAELGTPEVWERVWREAIALASHVPVYATSAPEGLEALAAAARRYTSISTP